VFYPNQNTLEQDVDKFLGFDNGYLIIANSVLLKYIEIPSDVFKKETLYDGKR
jgi:hypothetical protein